MNPTTHNSQLSTLNSLRSEIYRILSECFKEPCIEFAEDVANGRLHRVLSECSARLGIATRLEGLKMVTGDHLLNSASGRTHNSQLSTLNCFQALKDQYYPLFVGPFPPFALPVESVYKEWVREGAPVISSGVKGMLMGDSAIDMLKRYRAAGIEIPAQYKETPDHLALLLEYMALLCETGSDEEQARFIRSHMDWIAEFQKHVHACAEQRQAEPQADAARFYRTAVDATAAIVACEPEGQNVKSHKM